MDMFDWSSILDMLKIEPGHGLIQSLLLFMIWLQSRGLRKDVSSLRETFQEVKSSNEFRFQKIETRLTVLEGGRSR